MAEKFVKIAKLGSRVQELYLDDGANVAAVLEAAGESAEGYDLRVNGQAATGETPLADGDIVTLVPSIKGGC